MANVLKTVLYSFFLDEFFRSFSCKVFNEATSVIQLAATMYSFLHSFFPIGFLEGVFDEACVDRGIRPRGSVKKY